MCLETVKDRMDKPTTLIQSGWKTFNGPPAKPRFENFAFKSSKDVPLDKWITAEANVAEIVGRQISGYKPGFHIFEDETEFKGKKRRVYYRRAHTRGLQDGLTIVVALDMYVPSDPDGWPPR